MLETCFSQSQESTVFNIYHHCDLFQIEFVNVSSFQQYYLCFKHNIFNYEKSEESLCLEHF